MSETNWEKLLAGPLVEKESDKYVAWLFFRGGRDGTHLASVHTCDSDMPGAFKVYRWPVLADELLAHLRESGVVEQLILDELSEINKAAEADMLLGRPITGAHHRAIEGRMEQLRAAKAKLLGKGAE